MKMLEKVRRMMVHISELYEVRKHIGPGAAWVRTMVL